MKETIFTILNECEFLKNIELVEDNIFEMKKYEYIFSACMTYKKIDFLLKICIPNNWDRKLIDIYVTNYMDIPYIPHLGKSGKLCLFQTEGILIDKNLKKVIVICINRMKLILESGIDGKNKKDFISEFDSYVEICRNTINGKLLMESSNDIKKIKCDLLYYSRRIKRKIKYFESNELLLSNEEADFKIYCRKGTIYNGLYISIKSNEFIYPPDWRQNKYEEYFNSLLKKCKNYSEQFKDFFRKNKKYMFIIFTIKEPNNKIVNIGFQIINGKFDLKNLKLIDFKKIYLIKINIFNSYNLCERGGGNIRLSDKRVLVIGCGSIGGYLIEQLAKSGIRDIQIVDDDILSEENIFRHVLGMQYINRYKSEALCDYLKKNIPKINIIGIQESIEEALYDKSIDLDGYDLVISAIGNHNTNRWLNEYIFENNINTTMMYLWNESLDIGNHILITNFKKIGCYNCLFKFDDDGKIYDRTSYYSSNQKFTKEMQGCGSEYFPYTSTHSIRLVTYAIEYVKKILLGEINQNLLISIKGTDLYAKKYGLITSNRYARQTEVISILNGENFENHECKFCREKR